MLQTFIPSAHEIALTPVANLFVTNSVVLMLPSETILVPAARTSNCLWNRKVGLLL